MVNPTDPLQNESIDAKTALKAPCLKNLGRLIVGYLNINSIRNKLDALSEINSQNIDILMISETKIDSSFPKQQFVIDGYSVPLRLDRTKDGGGLLVYIRNGIVAHQLDSFKFAEGIECISLEVNLNKKKWVLLSVYRPPTQSEEIFLDNLGRALDKYSGEFENFIILGDFNMTVNERELKNFLDLYSLKSMIKEPTCFKSENPKCIDLVLTNRDRSVHSTTTVETGLSDFHKMILTVLKTKYQKIGASVINYRSYKNFNESDFKRDLCEAIGNTNPTDYESFQDVFNEVLDKHAPTKKKYVRANHAPFMTRALRKAVMLRSRLKNKHNNSRTVENWNNFRKQRNRCVKLFRQAKRDYYNKLDINLVTDNRKFWKTVKPALSDKCQSNNKIVLVEDDEIISDDTEVAEIFNSFFVTVTESLGIKENNDNISGTEGILDPIEKSIQKYSNHPSILRIKNRFVNADYFTFNPVSLEEMETEIKRLSPKKATTFKNIPPKILKNNSDICSEPLQEIFNNCIGNSTFPDELKCADVSSLHKQKESTVKKNYRPISVLPTVSKVFERLLVKQVEAHIEQYFSTLLCGFRKGYNTQQALVRFLEKTKLCIDVGGKVGAVMMDLSKAFDCLRHDLLIAKLHAYGFSHDALSLIYSYLHNRQQRVKVNGSFSSWKQLTLGVPQGSVLGPLLFNIYINDLLFSLNNTDVCNYADDTTLFACDIDTDSVVTRLELDSARAIKWFSDNYMKLNEDKCHLLTFGNISDDSVSVRIGSSIITNSTEEKLLGVTLDSKLTFEQHVSNLCQKVSNKLYALSRIAHYMDQNKLRILMKSFINSQFQYCPLAWMFHNRKLNTKINKLHERALRITYRDQEPSFEDLLGYDNSVFVHQKNLQVLMIEMFKTKHGLNPPFMKEIFCPQTNHYNLRNDRDFNLPRVRSVMYGSETVRYRGPQLWCTLPVSLRHSTNLIEFKTKIKAWKGNECQCQCRLCRNYVPLLGFI